MNEYHYSMHIVWDQEDEIFVVTVPELDGCMTHGKTYEEAVKNGEDAMNGLKLLKVLAGPFHSQETIQTRQPKIEKKA